jgi:hypothetical protein
MDHEQSGGLRSFQESVVVAWRLRDRFELAGWPVARTGVETPVVADRVNEALQVGRGLREGLILRQIDLLSFQGAKKLSAMAFS